MRTLLRLPIDIATAFFFSASIAIGMGVVATSYTHRLGDGFRMGALAFLVAAAGFGYAIWRNYRPLPKPAMRLMRTAQVAAPR
jgi:hypothetical protein